LHTIDEAALRIESTAHVTTSGLCTALVQISLLLEILEAPTAFVEVYTDDLIALAQGSTSLYQ
jgi:hypothetical protein